MAYKLAMVVYFRHCATINGLDTVISNTIIKYMSIEQLLIKKDEAQDENLHLCIYTCVFTPNKQVVVHR